MTALPVVMAMLALTGCAGTHVGDDWQCPLAQGEVCASVSAADPAVPASAERVDSPLPAGNVPLYRPSERDGPPLAGEGGNASAEAGKECGRGFGLFFPFAWLGSLFTPDSHASTVPASSADAGPGAGIASPSDVEPAEVGTRVTQDTATESVREPERIGRVWIGPFVDADGVYREASWVRIVIAPAEWRIP